MKHIVLLSDGTGNSSAKLFKTNVWRLYQSLDMDPDSAGVRQVACYNDGVGTSAFKPLALLGGAFGWGLKRNVLHLYDFLCQQWEPNDKIYIFGFSRGAFTGRVLAGLIARQGIVVGQDDRTRAYAIRDLYRKYRFDSRNVVDVPLIVKIVRPIRGAFIAGRRWLLRQANFAEPGATTNSTIRFLGVWDTVAAYGTPLAELTRGIDKKLFPLSMPDRTLLPEVLQARHALALDDERDTFHPLIWDEDETDPDRLKQVWFAGMHADVGGGYPDDSLSWYPLVWMMEEAKQAGLRFLPHALERFAPPSSRSAPLHDSRQGLSGYYRYQPRRLSAYLLPDDPETAIMRDPSPRATAHMKCILIHHSVIERIQASATRYAPVVLPERFEVVQSNGQIVPSPETEPARKARMAGQARVFDIVWWKRVAYFAMVLVSLVPASLPVWGAKPESGACQAFYCALAPLIRAVGAFLPGILQYWTDALANNLPITLAFAAILTALLLFSGYLQAQIRDTMWQLWAPLRGANPASTSRKPSLVNRLRTSQAYLAIVRTIKWQVLPQVLGSVAAAIVSIGAVGLFGVPWMQHAIAAREASSQICRLGSPAHDAALFHTDVPCWRYKEPVQAGTQYRVELTIKEPWLDGTTPASPLGIDIGAYDGLRGYGSLPFRRTLSGRWYQPFVTIQPEPATGHASQDRPVVQPLEFMAEGDRFVARLVPAASGHLDFWVNQSVLGFRGLTGADYADNHGSAQVCIVEQASSCPSIGLSTDVVRSGSAVARIGSVALPVDPP